MKTLTRVFLVLFSLISLNAFADGMFRFDFGYVMDDKAQGATDNKETRQLMDFAGGYIWPVGFVVLGQYAMEKDISTGGGTTNESNRTSYGPGIGWISRQAVGAYITGTYYFSSKYVASGINYDGTGYQLDVGLRVDLSKVFLLAGMSYEAFEYTKNNSTALSPSVKHSHIDPRIGVQFEF